LFFKKAQKVYVFDKMYMESLYIHLFQKAFVHLRKKFRSLERKKFVHLWNKIWVTY
jgi:hypothetical protein